ncbi:MAG: cupredoxin domain-containing protein, partial [Candidatus Eremiobacteraeota bacterium]|nr:cupredoxin domain-containing protein [Candidatus Eremiobacteraeota bacterium]
MNANNVTRFVAALASGAALVLTLPASAPADSGSATPVLVVIKNYAFTPATITVAPGTAVQWRNDDSASHTATAADGTFDSKNLDRGQTYTFTFAKPGT